MNSIIAIINGKMTIIIQPSYNIMSYARKKFTFKIKNINIFLFFTPAITKKLVHI